MDGNNWRLTGPGGEPAMDASDWRAQLQPDSRQQTVNKIMDTLKKHLPFAGQDGIEELKKIAVRMEEKIYTAATSQSDYLQKISLKIFTMEPRSQTPISNFLPPNASANSSRPPDPGASLDSTVQTGHANAGDWQEEVYQKIKVMKDTYLPELNEIYTKIDAKLQQHDSLSQQPKTEQLEKLKMFKTMLERIIQFLQVPKNSITQGFREKLGSYEKQIINFVNVNRPRKPMTTLQPGQVPQSHIQQPQSQLPQVSSHENQMKPQMQSMNLQGSVSTMQQNMSSLHQSSLSSLSGGSTLQPNMMNSLQPSSNLDSAQGNAMSSLQQAAVGLQQNTVSTSQQANVNNLTSQSGVNKRKHDSLV